MAQCLQCKKMWESYGGGYEFCDKECFDRHWEEAVNYLLDYNDVPRDQTREVINTMAAKGLIRINDNY